MDSSLSRKIFLTLDLIHTLSLTLSAFYRDSNQLIHRSIDLSINTLVNTSIDQSINPLIHWFIDHLIDRSIDRSINPSIIHPPTIKLIYPLIDLSIHRLIDRYNLSMHWSIDRSIPWFWPKTWLFPPRLQHIVIFYVVEDLMLYCWWGDSCYY